MAYLPIWCDKCRAYLGVIDDEGWMKALFSAPHMPGCLSGEQEERQRQVDELELQDAWR